MPVVLPWLLSQAMIDFFMLDQVHSRRNTFSHALSLSPSCLLLPCLSYCLSVCLTVSVSLCVSVGTWLILHMPSVSSAVVLPLFTKSFCLLSRSPSLVCLVLCTLEFISSCNFLCLFAQKLFLIQFYSEFSICSMYIDINIRKTHNLNDNKKTKKTKIIQQQITFIPHIKQTSATQPQYVTSGPPE